MNLTIPNTQNIDTNISFIKDLINTNLDDFKGERIYDLLNYFEKNPNLIPIFVRNVFDNEYFYPSVFKLDVNEDIISNVNLIENEDPDYGFTYLYSFLKHPVFSDSINTHRSKLKRYNSFKKFMPVPVRVKREKKERSRSIADALSILGKFNKKVKSKNISKCPISIVLKHRKEGYQKV
tara:strand:- start:299 stop:835 length:537 start_codon:yes stop_codon:yes gene_type:complete